MRGKTWGRSNGRDPFTRPRDVPDGGWVWFNVAGQVTEVSPKAQGDPFTDAQCATIARLLESTAIRLRVG